MILLYKVSIQNEAHLDSFLVVAKATQENCTACRVVPS